ncbi:MAG: hypothetical protein WA055_01260 [Candidatus Moraniibacteriota bacterium]
MLKIRSHFPGDAKKNVFAIVLRSVRDDTSAVNKAKRILVNKIFPPARAEGKKLKFMLRHGKREVSFT